MSSKKEKRSEAKKRKLEALINLMGEEEEDGREQAKKFKNSPEKVKDESSCKSRELTSNGETLEEIRKRLRERQKASMQKAKIFLDPKYEEQSLNAIYPMDIQHLLLYAVQGNVASYKPRWCKLIRQVRLSGVVVIIVDSVSSADVTQHQNAFRFLTENFPLRIEVISPSQYGRTFDEELFAVPMSARQVTLSTRSADCNGTDKGTVRDFRFTAQSLESIKSSTANTSEESLTRSVSCLDLILSEEQLKLEGYPLPLVNSPQYSKYKFSKAAYSHPSEKSPLFAIDCEMVRTKVNNKELAWIAVVNEGLECVYESLVKPRAAVVDYLTEFSGVTKKLLENVTTSLGDVQKKLRSILPTDAILVGQSLGNDLQSLEMFHPFIIDTSVIYNLSGIPLKKTGLKRLSSEFLGRDIQMGKAGHNPREDAIATMELVLKKLKHGLEYGNVLNGWICGSEKDPLKPDEGQNNKETLRAEDDRSSEDKESGKTENGMLRRKFFFQKTRTSNCQSLFTIAKRSEKSVALAGFETRWAEEAEILGDKDESDGTVAKQTYLSKANHFCVFSQLNGFGQELRRPNNCSNCLVRSMQDVVKQVKRIVKHLSENNLVVVVLSGRSEANSSQNGLCFLKIL